MKGTSRKIMTGLDARKTNINKGGTFCQTFLTFWKCEGESGN